MGDWRFVAAWTAWWPMAACRYRALGTVHLAPLRSDGDGEVIWLVVETNQSHIRIATAARTRLFRHGEQLELEADHTHSDGYTEQRFLVNVTPGDEVIVEKIAAMAATIDVVQRCYTGLEMRQDVLRFNPVIPAELGSVGFDIRYRGLLLHLEFTTEVARVHVDLAEGAPITVDITGHTRTLIPGQTREVKLA